MRPRDPAVISKQRTDCRADIGTEARVSDESVGFPRHTPPRAGPHQWSMVHRVGVALKFGALALKGLKCTYVQDCCKSVKVLK